MMSSSRRQSRWIKSSELVDNMDERSLIALDKWGEKLQKALQEARQRSVSERSRMRTGKIYVYGLEPMV